MFGFSGLTRMWVLRLDADGNVKWQKTYGGRDGEGAHAIAIADNGDIIVAGYTSSFGAGLADVWVLRLDENGAMFGFSAFLRMETFRIATSAETRVPR
ncbi:MAG: hypothetical protein PWP19_1351 [Thermococcaceae archaeon]|nr:hypothetical protein [Thermococcaceae archaeon]